MCGIAGVFHYADIQAKPDRAALERMTRVIAHRGPDDEGFFVDGPVAFGHRRLSIVDLSPTGKQPMQTPEGAFCLTYNGEFYNHADFRGRLAARGAMFRGTSDTETLLHLMAVFGPRALSETAGIFAFGFWDQAARRLTIARDQLGVKQVYFHDDGKRVVFASEIKAVLEYPGVPREIDPNALNEYLHFHTPLFSRTFFKGIDQVRAGEFIEVTSSGVRRRVYAETDGFAPRHESPGTAVADLKTLLARVVQDQLMSDVPVGTFFSGGIDSTAIAAFAKRTGAPIRGFGIHFSGGDVIDERPYQEAAATAIALPLDLTTIDGSDFATDLPKLIWHQDEPVIGAAMIPMYYVSKLAAKNVKVCLGGQGADEIFGGYARYALVHPGQVIASYFSRPKTVDPLAGDVKAAAVGGNLLKQLADFKNLRRLARTAAQMSSWSTRYFENFANVSQADWRTVFSQREMISRAAARAEFDAALRRSPAHDPGDRILHWDIQTYLTGLFHQDDRMSMANSLESRVPMADPRMVRFALHTDFSLKLRGGASKWLLRQAVADVVPAFVLNRRKVGFDTPAERWMRGMHSGFVRETLLSSRARSRGFWNVDGVQKILDASTASNWFDMVWKMLCIETWARTFLDGESHASA